MLKTTFENLLFACRWLLIPFYVAMVAVLVMLLVKVVTHAYELVMQFQISSEEQVILGALGVVDLTLVACLVILVIFSTYSNFITRVDTTYHEDWPAWMTGIDYGELKLKLIASIVAISSIKLLESYMNVEHETDRQLAWELGIYGSFLAASLLLALSEALGHWGDGAKNGKPEH